jgi:hypothetical protein
MGNLANTADFNVKVHKRFKDIKNQLQIYKYDHLKYNFMEYNCDYNYA